MTPLQARQAHLAMALTTMQFSPTLQLRCWTEGDFPAIEHLSTLQGWPTPHTRPAEALTAWQQSWPALIVIATERVVGFVRGITEGEITTYIAELLVDPKYRGQGIGRLLLDACHALYPHTRLDLISTEEAISFYQVTGFRYVGVGLRKSYR